VLICSLLAVIKVFFIKICKAFKGYEVLERGFGFQYLL